MMYPKNVKAVEQKVGPGDRIYECTLCGCRSGWTKSIKDFGRWYQGHQEYHEELDEEVNLFREEG